MNTIQQADLIDSIADALQFISYYHPVDYIQAVGRAGEDTADEGHAIGRERQVDVASESGRGSELHTSITAARAPRVDQIAVRGQLPRT